MLRRRFLIQAIAAALVIPPSGRLLAQTTVHTEAIDPFGQEITLPKKTIVFASGTGDWDTAYETLLDAFKSIQVFLDKKGMKAAGPAMTIYTALDDMTFNFQAAMPVTELPKGPGQDNISTGTSPAGKALKFVHRGSFDAMTMTYDAIAHFVEEKQISAKELLIEEYVSDFLTTPADKLVINIFVPVN